MSLRIGILGGTGPSGTLDYYGGIIRKYQERFNDLNYPEIVIFSLSHGRFKKYEDGNETGKYVEYIMEGVRGLEAAGAGLIAFAANSPHGVLGEIRKRTHLPVISLLDPAARYAVENGVRKALLLGIKFTMQSDFFQRRFADEGIEVITPAEQDQDRVHGIIKNELVKGIVREDSQALVLEIIRQNNIGHVILGCNRLPMLIRDGMNGIRCIDTMDLHLNEILDQALTGRMNRGGTGEMS